MRHVPSPPARALLALALAALAAANGSVPSPSTDAQPDVPVATADELADLDVDVKRVDEASEEHGTSIVEIEVRNRGERLIEPLAFRIRPRGRDAAPLDVTRVAAPVYGRAGRPIEPKRRERFRMLVDAPADTLKRARAEVTSASAWAVDSSAADVDVDDGDVRVGRPDVRRDDFRVRTSVELENRSDWPLDVVLEARFEQGGGGTTQYRVRLEARESRVETFDRIPRSLGATSDPVEWNADLDRIDVVDWSAVIDDGAALARAALEDVWDGWKRVPLVHFPLSATVRADVDLRGRFGEGGERFDVREKVEARVTIESDGTCRLSDARGEPLAGGASRAVQNAVDDAALHVARADFATASAGWSIGLVSIGPSMRVRIGNAAAVFGSTDVVVELLDGAIARVLPPGGGPAAEARATLWSTVGAEDSWRLVSTAADLDSQGKRTSAFTYATTDAAADELVLAEATFFTESKLTDAPERVVLVFDEWAANTATVPPPAPPTGPLAERLRAAWARHHRLASDTTEFRGRFEVTSAGTDGVWIGRKKVGGEFVLSGGSGSYWNHSTCTVDDEKATADERKILVGAFEDRLLMWTGRDPCRWAPFDEAFAGAELRPAKDGWIEVTGVRHYGAVRIDDGRVVAWRTPQGIATSLTWTEKGGVLLPRTITRPGNGRATLEWKEVDDGVWFPTRIELEEYFGADWDPETLEFEVESVTQPQ